MPSIDPSFAHSPAPREALFLVRPERNESGFIREHGGKMHGLVLASRLLAPAGPTGGSAPTDDLPRAARDASCPYLHDPDTAVLAWHRGVDEDRFGRSANMPCARLVSLPLTASDFDREEDLLAFVRSAMSTQVGASHASAVYFCVDGLADPWTDVNLRAAVLTRKLAGNRRLALFVSGTIEALRSGSLAQLAVRYAERVNAPAMLFLSVAGLYTEEASPEDLAAFLLACTAFRDQGFDVIADRVGRFGATAVADGALGYCAGTRVYRHTPATPEWENDYSIKIPMKYEAARRSDRIARSDVSRRLSRQSLPACPVAKCPVTITSVNVPDLRLHSIHLQQHEVAEAARLKSQAWAARLKESERAYVRGWGTALDLTLAARKAA